MKSFNSLILYLTTYQTLAPRFREQPTFIPPPPIPTTDLLSVQVPATPPQVPLPWTRTPVEGQGCSPRLALWTTANNDSQPKATSLQKNDHTRPPHSPFLTCPRQRSNMFPKNVLNSNLIFIAGCQPLYQKRTFLSEKKGDGVGVGVGRKVSGPFLSVS